MILASSLEKSCSLTLAGGGAGVVPVLTGSLCLLLGCLPSSSTPSSWLSLDRVTLTLPPSGSGNSPMLWEAEGRLLLVW